MKKNILRLGVLSAIILSGCTSVETKYNNPVRYPLNNKWSTNDQFHVTSSHSSSTPLQTISPRSKIKLTDDLYKLLVRYDGTAANEYFHAKKAGKDLDKLTEKALVTIVHKQMNEPLNEKFVVKGISILERNPSRNPSFTAPDLTLYRLAIRNSNKKEKEKIIILYYERHRLYQNILRYMKECGLKRKDLYWIPLFTYLELELIGLEKSYKQHARKTK